MNEMIIILGGAFVMGSMQLFKRAGIDQKQSTLILSVLLGVGYFSYTFFVPQALQQEVTSFVVGSIGTAKIVYDFVTKILLKKE